MRLELDRCVVRPWAASDLDALVRHADNPNVARHLRDRFPHPYGRQHGVEFLAAVIRAPRPTVWCIEVDGACAGGIGIEVGRDVERVSAEIGYWLGEPYWGRGIATEVLVGVTAEVLVRFDLQRVFAMPFAGNAASIRVLEKAGYVLEGRLRQSAVKHGRVVDQLVYARYRPDAPGD
ncbi:MAG: GNAT family N-acetyltransferase [Vicinamibacterales bacterium]